MSGDELNGDPNLDALGLWIRIRTVIIFTDTVPDPYKTVDVRHVTGNDKDYLRKIPRVVV